MEWMQSGRRTIQDNEPGRRKARRSYDIEQPGRTLHRRKFGHIVGVNIVGVDLDAEANIVVAGATNSPDYPTTPRAYQPQYLFYPAPSGQPHGFSAPVESGHVTKLNESGTGLIWSTFFSGSGTEASANTFVDGDAGGIAARAESAYGKPYLGWIRRSFEP